MVLTALPKQPFFIAQNLQLESYSYLHLDAELIYTEAPGTSNHWPRLARPEGREGENSCQMEGGACAGPDTTALRSEAFPSLHQHPGIATSPHTRKKKQRTTFSI